MVASGEWWWMVVNGGAMVVDGGAMVVDGGEWWCNGGEWWCDGGFIIVDCWFYGGCALMGSGWFEGGLSRSPPLLKASCGQLASRELQK